MNAALRLQRTAALSVVVLALAAAAHGSAGRALPSAGHVMLLAAVVGLPAWFVTSRRLSPGALLLFVIGGQWLLRTAFCAMAHGPAAAEAAHHAAAPAAMPAAHAVGRPDAARRPFTMEYFMSRSTVLLPIGAAALLTASLAGCGNDSGTDTAEPAADAPTVDIKVTPDKMGGFNLQTTTDNFTWAPQHASGDAVPGEGHAHVYVDGEKVTRVYSEWHFIGPMVMEPGEHEVTVTLNGNDHNQYSADGEPVEATVTAMKMDDEHTH